MKTQKNFLNRINLLLLAFIILSACGKDTEEANSFDETVNALDTFEQEAELSSPEVIEQSDPELDESTGVECYTTTYNAAPGFDELLALDPTSDVIYPGAMLEGNSIPTGEYIPINTDRAPITLSISLQNLSGSPVVEIEDPKLSTVRTGIKSILDQDVVSATPAKINYEIKKVYSEQHLNIALGANYRSAGNSVSGSFNFSNSEYKNRFVLKYLQVYYTIDMDSPEKPSDLFNNIPDVSDLGATAPVYVSSISYGRMVLYTIETNRSETEINAAFNASFNSGGGSLDADYQKTIDESNIKALVIGGSGAAASQTIQGPGEVYNFIAEGGDYSKDSPGAPLSYKLRFVKQGTPVARVVLSTEYQIRNCEFVSHRYYVEINSIECKDCKEVGKPELYGTISAVDMNNKQIVKWSKTKDNAVKVENDKYTISGVNGTVDLYKPNQTDDYIKLSAELFEKDAFSDDDFGKKTLKVKLFEIPMGDDGVEKTINLTEDNSDVVIKFTLIRER
jgi:thiol-activated cytolysin